MKYTLIAEDEFDATKTTREFTADHLADVVNEFQYFLKGAGFVFDGMLDFVPEHSDYLADDEEWNLANHPTISEDLPKNNWPFPGFSATPTVGVTDGEYSTKYSQYFYDTERNK